MLFERIDAARNVPRPCAPKRLVAFVIAAAMSACATGRIVPIADHHQHIFSPQLVLMSDTTGKTPPLTARDLIALLDSAGIKKAVLLSSGYMYGRPSRHLSDEYERVRAENDWNAAQAAEYPDRLVAFCGFNPLKDYAVAEIERCSRNPRLSRGIKLHFGNSDVQLENPDHLERVRRVFAAADAHGMAIVVHMRASISLKRPYGAAQARLFLEQLLPAAPHVVVQIAHLAGTGPGYDDPPADSAMSFFADAMQRGDPRMRNVWFDVAGVANVLTPQTAALMAKRIRQVGASRILYGSDAAFGGNLRPRESWAAFRTLPLSESEFRTIANNIAPYLR